MRNPAMCLIPFWRDGAYFRGLKKQLSRIFCNNIVRLCELMQVLIADIFGMKSCFIQLFHLLKRFFGHWRFGYPHL